jgi:signal transduction histidine kinase
MSLSKQLSGFSPWRLALFVFILIFGGSCLVTSYLYLQAVWHRESDTRIYVRELAMAAAGLVDVELHEQLVRPEQLGSAEYRRVLSPLVQFHLSHPSIQYLWTTRVAADGRQLFLLETSTDERIRSQQTEYGRKQDILSFLETDPPTEAGSRSMPVLRSGAALVLDGIYADSHGEYIESRAPLQNQAGQFVGYIGVDYALDSYRERINEVRVTGLVTLGLAFVVSMLVASVMAEMRRQTFVHLKQVERAEAEMRVQRDKADQASQAKSELLAIASHDLKNPLSAIAGMSGLLLQQKRTTPEQSGTRQDIEALESIHSAAKHMSDIVRSLLLNEGIEYGGLSVQAAPFDAVKLLADIIQFNRPSAVRKRISLEVVTEAHVPVTADKKLLHEAFDNYVSNAIKYSPPGRRVSVRLKANQATAEIELEVQDEGPGLTVEDQSQLFQKFKKLSARPTGGETSTGLGLSIVKTIVELHHGRVGCESGPGRGARFWLKLPLQPPVA